MLERISEDRLNWPSKVLGVGGTCPAKITVISLALKTILPLPRKEGRLDYPLPFAQSLTISFLSPPLL